MKSSKTISESKKQKRNKWVKIVNGYFQGFNNYTKNKKVKIKVTSIRVDQVVR